MMRWTATGIAQHIQSLLHDTRLILVSNREPYIHRWDRQALLEPVMKDPSAPVQSPWNFDWALRIASRVSQLLRSGEGIRWTHAAGGLTSALDPVMQACHGTWVAWGSGNADRETVDANDRVRVPPNAPNSRCAASG